MCIYCGGNSMVHFAIGLGMALVLFSFGVALSAVGEESYRLSKCPVEPALSLWMVAAGVSLLLITTFVVIVIVCKTSNKASVDDGGAVHRCCCCFWNLHRSTVASLSWAFCCGVVLVLWYMISFSLWIAGSYLAVVTIQKMRVVRPANPEVVGGDCSPVVIGVAGAAIVTVWAIFFAICCNVVYTVCDNSFLRQQNREGPRHEGRQQPQQHRQRRRRRWRQRQRPSGNEEERGEEAVGYLSLLAAAATSAASSSGRRDPRRDEVAVGPPEVVDRRHAPGVPDPHLYDTVTA